MSPEGYLILSAILFAIGIAGFLLRRSAIIAFLSIELMLNATNLAFVAFARFHGISPKAAKERGAELKSFAPLRIKLTLEGGNMMEYKIVEKAAFSVMGIGRKFNADTSYQEIPKFRNVEHFPPGGRRSHAAPGRPSLPQRPAETISKELSSARFFMILDKGRTQWYTDDQRLLPMPRRLLTVTAAFSGSEPGKG